MHVNTEAVVINAFMPARVKRQARRDTYVYVSVSIGV